jgi:hypothetical protein
MLEELGDKRGLEIDGVPFIGYSKVTEKWTKETPSYKHLEKMPQCHPGFFTQISSASLFPDLPYLLSMMKRERLR